MWRCGISALVLLLTLFVTDDLHAEPALVVLIRPSEQSPIVNEAITRIRGELVADGFDVSIVDAPPGADPASLLSQSNEPTRTSATLALFLRADAQSAEVWLVDRLTGKTVMRRVELTTTPAHSAPEVLARRSVELLRASLLEILVETRDEPVPSPGPRKDASRWASKGLSARPSRWGIEGGAQVLAGFGGVPAAVMPVGRVRFAFHERLAARLSLSGLGTRPRVEAPAGSATVSQGLGLLELVCDILPRSLVVPSVSLGAGAYHIGVDGSANWPYAGSSENRFVLAADAGLGLALSLTSSLVLSLEGHAVLLTPYPVIRFLEVDAAEVGNPLVAGALTLAGRL
jgi:hypothetical protein